MDAAVVELDALADAIGAAAEDHDFFPGRLAHFVVATVISRIVVWRVSFELGGAGIDQAIAGNEADFFPIGTNGVLGLAGEMGNLAVGKTERLGLGQQFRIHLTSGQTQTRQSKPKSAATVQF